MRHRTPSAPALRRPAPLEGSRAGSAHARTHSPPPPHHPGTYHRVRGGGWGTRASRRSLWLGAGGRGETPGTAAVRSVCAVRVRGTAPPPRPLGAGPGRHGDAARAAGAVGAVRAERAARCEEAGGTIPSHSGGKGGAGLKTRARPIRLRGAQCSWLAGPACERL